MENTIIYLIGHAGTGKYTVAQELCKKADIRLVDNHLINNPVFSLIDTKTDLPDTVWAQTDKIRQVVFDTMRHVSAPHFSFVLTNCLFDDEGDRRIFEQVRDLARARNALFVPVVLRASEAEMVKRRTDPLRAARFKDTCTENLRRDLKERVLLPFDDPNKLDLDVTTLTADETAHAILAFIEKKR